jgi:hypothetical protein
LVADKAPELARELAIQIHSLIAVILKASVPHISAEKIVFERRFSVSPANILLEYKERWILRNKE